MVVFTAHDHLGTSETGTARLVQDDALVLPPKLTKKRRPDPIATNCGDGLDDTNALQTSCHVANDQRKLEYPPLPPPPLKPSGRAALRSITIHFCAFDDGGTILGFTFVYSDDIHITKGGEPAPFSGTISRTLGLDSGEHIIKCEIYQHRYSRLLQRIRFKTTLDRWLDAQRLNRLLPEAHAMRQATLVEFPFGKVLRSIDWCPAMKTIKDFQCVPLADIELTDKETKISSLAYLSWKTLDDAMCRKAIQIEKCKLVENVASSQSEKEIQQIFRRYHDQLNSSPKVDTLRELRSLKRRAEAKLYGIANTIASPRLDTTRNHEKYFSLEVCPKSLSFTSDRDEELAANIREQHALMQLYFSSEHALCRSSYCRKVYLPRNLPTWKRCSLKGCRSGYEDCGCGVQECSGCRMSFCKLHAADHKTKCRPVTIFTGWR